MPPNPTQPTSEDEIRLERLRSRRRRYTLTRLFRANLREMAILGREARLSLALLTLLLLGSALYLRTFYFPQLCSADGEYCGREGDFGSAFYVTILLLVFETPIPFPSDFSGRILFFGVPLFGLFFLLQSVVDFARLLFNKGARREGWQISLASTFSGHVIVCGIGHVGYRVVLQLLDTGYEVVGVDMSSSSEFATIMTRLKVPLIVGDARDPDVLRYAGLGRARSVVAAISDDLQNVEIALTARRQRPAIQTVLRIINRELDRNLERSFGRNSAFSSTELAASTFAAAAVSQDIVHVVNLPEGLLALSELRVEAESELSGFVDALEQRFAVRLMRLRDANNRERERGFMARLDGGDRVLLLGTLAALERVRQANMAGNKLDFLSANPAAPAPCAQRQRVIVCGLGRVGAEMVRLITNIHPQPEVVVICRPDTASRMLVALKHQGIRVIQGDARDPELLEAAGIAQACTVAAVVSDDLTNLQVGLAARKLQPSVHLVLRVFSDVLAERLATLFGINTTYSTSALAAPTLAAAAILREVDHAFDIGARLFATETFNVMPDNIFVGKSVAQLRTQQRILVTALRRDGQTTLLPPHDCYLTLGDEIVVLADLRVLAELRSL
ncbi:MAG: potassium transporter TrkA [Candidatus Viridilinea halotolerans]|uniref:Potassium transporter TrkA n=1 Tax=Candidatus Viridilinea halotolerans TaxID=2491704 RepID=A0A426U398_9CHLR|nr:MAG: potassium transporter TrkA [Candidatus Viridilinea halotolerans]